VWSCLRSRDRAGAAEHREGPLRTDALDVLPRGHQQLSGVSGRDAQQFDCARRCDRDELLEFAVQFSDLSIERFDPPGDRAQRELCGLRGRTEI